MLLNLKPVYYDQTRKQVPRMALTVGVGTVLDAREVVVIVTGQRKALALSKAIEEGVNHLVRTPLFVLSSLHLSERPRAVDTLSGATPSLGAHRRRRRRDARATRQDRALLPQHRARAG